MRKLVSMILSATLLLSLAPAVASAKNAQHGQKGQEKAAAKAEEGTARKAEHAADKAAREASRSADAVEASASDEGTRAVGPGVTTAMSRITANIEKAIAKITAGGKSQLPPGLVRVWLKFATWLGVDKATMPQPPVAETTSTVEPTATAEARLTP